MFFCLLCSFSFAIVEKTNAQEGMITVREKLTVGCLLMAAGNAERFGENKLLCAAWDGRSLIEHALDAIPRECFARVLVVTQYPEITALAKERGFETLQNWHPERGQSETIRLGTGGAFAYTSSRCCGARRSRARSISFHRTASASLLSDTTARGAIPASSPPASSRNFSRLKVTSAAARSSKIT